MLTEFWWKPVQLRLQRKCHWAQAIQASDERALRAESDPRSASCGFQLHIEPQAAKSVHGSVFSPAARLENQAATKQQADAPEGRSGSDAPPMESAPWAPSTGTCSLRPS